MPIQVALKELRETAWIALVALAAYLYFLGGAIGVRLFPWRIAGDNYQYVPFVNGSLSGEFTKVAVCLAIGLGLWQTVVESRRGTFLFLLHRPVSRTAVIGTKLLVGAGLYLVCSAVPILIFAVLAATPGTHASPFEWSMTADVWETWITLTALYLGAFLSGIRPGRWFGTRLIPLAGAGLAVLVIVRLPWWLVFGLPALVVVGGVLLVGIFFVARTRDYS
jgi:hypothetical protein